MFGLGTARFAGDRFAVIGDIPAIIDWHKSTSVIESGGYVSQMNALVGTNHLTNSDPATQLQYSATPEPVVIKPNLGTRFISSNIVGFGLGIGISIGTIILATPIAAPTSQKRIWNLAANRGSNFTGFSLLTNGSNIDVTSRAGTVVGNSLTVLTTEKTIMSLQCFLASQEFQVLQASTTELIAAPATAAQQGNYQPYVAGITSSTVNFYEFVTYTPETPASTDRWTNMIKAILAWENGMQTSLDASNPYKINRPTLSDTL